jgi:hypothetical protein
MGVKDIITKDYMRESEIFADAFNQYIYKGQQVIKVEKLKPLNNDIVGVPYGADGAGVPVQRFRDVLKSASAMEDDDRIYLLLAIEAQSEVNHVMPIRNMVYDALQYAAQVEEAARSHRKARKEGILEELEKKPDAGEYLSGFYRGDRLIPVITLVLYFAPGEWDGPMSLHEMLAVQDPEILSFVSDYKLNLIAPGSMSDEEINQFSTSLREVMLFIKYSKDKTKLNEIVQKDDRFKTVDRKAVNVISNVTGIKFKVKEEEEKVDMCEGMRGLLEDATNEGVQQGIQQGIQQIALRMLKANCFSMEMIAQITGLSVQDILALQL